MKSRYFLNSREKGYDLTEAIGSNLSINLNNKMNKTDVVFYLSMVVVVWDKISDMVKPLVSNTLFSWLAVVAVVVGTVSYTLYSKFTGTIEVAK